MTRSRLPLVAALLVWGLCSSAFASKSNTNAARSAFNEGVAHFEAERYEDAVRAFRRAHELSPSWKIFYNIGQGEAALKRYGLAIESFERYLAQGGDDIAVERRDEVVAEIRRLKEMIGDLEIRAPHGTEIVIDGTSRGTTPLSSTLRVTAGIEHHVQLFEGGVELLARSVTVGSGQLVVIDTSAPVEGPSSDEEFQPTPVEPFAAPQQPERSGLKPTFFWVGIGATAALGIGAVAMELAVRSKWKAAEGAEDNGALIEDGKTLQKVSITLIALTGSAAIATGMIALFTDFERRDDATAAALKVAPWADEHSGGLVLQGRF